MMLGGVTVDRELYELVSMAARYWFCALLSLIAFRAWRVTVKDNRRASLLRIWSPETGCIGEFVVNPGKGKKSETLPIPKEGVLGASRKCDVCVRSRDVKRYHLALEQRQGGVLATPIGRARALKNNQVADAPVFLRDGDTLTIGTTKLLLVMFEPDAKKGEPDPFDEDLLWGSKPPEKMSTKAPEKTSKKTSVKSRKPRSTKRDPMELFEDELWPDE